MKKFFLSLFVVFFIFSFFLSPLYAYEDDKSYFNGEEFPVLRVDPYGVMPIYDYEGYTYFVYYRDWSLNGTTGGWTLASDYFSTDLVGKTLEVAVDITLPKVIPIYDKCYWTVGLESNKDLNVIDYISTSAYRPDNNYKSVPNNHIFEVQSSEGYTYQNYSCSIVPWFLIDSDFKSNSGDGLSMLSLRFKVKINSSITTNIGPYFNVKNIIVTSSTDGQLNQTIVDNSTIQVETSKSIWSTCKSILAGLLGLPVNVANALAGDFLGLGKSITDSISSLPNSIKSVFSHVCDYIIFGWVDDLAEVLRNVFYDEYDTDHDDSEYNNFNLFKESLSNFESNLNDSFNNIKNNTIQLFNLNDFSKTSLFLSNSMTNLYNSHSAVNGMVTFSLIVGFALCVIGINIRR